MKKPEHVYDSRDKTRGDFWLWACIDADTKLVFSHRVGKRNWSDGWHFVGDVAKRVNGPVQIATDQLAAYPFHIREHFGYEGFSYGTETKVLGEPRMRFSAEGARLLERPRDSQSSRGVQFGVYNFVRKHATLKTAPAVAAALEEKPWSLERVVEMTEALPAPEDRESQGRESVASAHGRGCDLRKGDYSRSVKAKTLTGTDPR